LNTIKSERVGVISSFIYLSKKEKNREGDESWTGEKWRRKRINGLVIFFSFLCQRWA
jgi:hypothetical protein